MEHVYSTTANGVADDASGQLAKEEAIPGSFVTGKDNTNRTRMLTARGNSSSNKNKNHNNTRNSDGNGNGNSNGNNKVIHSGKIDNKRMTGSRIRVMYMICAILPFLLFQKQIQHHASILNRGDNNKTTVKRSYGNVNGHINNQSEVAVESEKEPIVIPHALIIGTQKGGTGALVAYLKKHPDVVFSTRKEAHYFDWFSSPNEFPNGTIPQQDVQQYLRRYTTRAYNVTKIENARAQKKMLMEKDMKAIGTATAATGKEIVIIEKTPIYMFHHKAPLRIQSTLPKTKLIVLLRDPVERAFSHYKMNRNGKDTFEEFEEWVEKDIELLKRAGLIPNDETRNHQRRIIDWIERNSTDFDRAWKNYLTDKELKSGTTSIGRGMYIAQLRVFWRAYGSEKERRKQILIIKSENMRPSKDGYVNLKNITDFIGIPELDFTSGKEVIHATKGDYVLREETKTRMRNIYFPYNLALSKMLGPDWHNTWSR